MKLQIATAVALAASAVCAQAASTTPVPYFVGSVGYSKMDTDDGEKFLQDFFGASETSAKDDSVSANGGVGLQLNEFVSFEVQYMHVGKFELEGDGSKLDIKITGPALGAVGSYPLNKDTSVFVRADAIYAQIEIEEERTRKWQPAVGVGISHHIADGFSVRGQYQYMFLKEKDLDIDAPVHNVSVGVTQTF